MSRKTKEELNVVMKKYGVSRLWSWSKVNTFMTSPYEYFLSYVLRKQADNDNCAYAPIGSAAHECLEKYYLGEMSHDDMLNLFEDKWIVNIDIADLKFDRNDDAKNESIKTKYKYDIEHFFKNHKPMADNVAVEKFVTARVGSNVFQGYIDAIMKDDAGNVCIIDFKTSSKFSAKAVEEKSGQLTVYAMALMQAGVPMDKIRIGFNMLKYCTIRYTQKNGAEKTRDVERCKIGEALQTNARMWLKTEGCSEAEADAYLKCLLDSNNIASLPNEVAEKYEVSDCFVWVPLTQKLVDKWTENIIATISDIVAREKDYEETKNDKVFWDDEESVNKESFYFATLCSYSARLHKPYGEYLDKLNAKSNIWDFTNKTNENAVVANKVVCDNGKNEDIDLSWLDSIH